MEGLWKREIANVICLGRLMVSLLITLYAVIWRQPSVVVPVLCSLMLISDLLDGYFYRKYAEKDPPQHWFNRLPITLDPIADFVFGMSNWAYLLLTGDKMAQELALPILLFLPVFGIGGNLLERRPERLIVLTYGWFSLAMVAPICVMWLINWQSEIGAMGILVTFASFYWLANKLKSRKTFL